MSHHDSPMWLVYVDATGKQHYQPWEDISTAGVLIDDDGEDMELIGWTDDAETATRTYRFSDEGRVDGVRYVTVLDDGGNPVEYNIAYDDAVSKYGVPE